MKTPNLNFSILKRFLLLLLATGLTDRFCEKLTLKKQLLQIEKLIKFYYNKIILNRIPFYDVRVDKVERVQRRFIRYALRGLG
jgi:hypothetical protein